MMEEEIFEEEPVEERRVLRPIFLPALAVILIIAAGVATGFFLSSRKPLPSSEAGKIEGEVRKGMVAGVDKPEIFRDTAVGVLEVNEGELTQEGSHKLLREGGPSQTAYLISSVVDLDKFVGHKVKVWGETFAGQKAGWLMDIGKLEVLE